MPRAARLFLLASFRRGPVNADVIPLKGLTTMKTIFAILLMLSTLPSIANSQERVKANTLDQAVAAGIALKLEYVIDRANESTVDTDLFPKILETLNHDAKSFSQTKSGNRQRETVRRIAVFVKFVYTERLPSKNVKFIELLKQHGLDQNSIDPEKVSKAVNDQIVSFVKTSNLDRSILRSERANQLPGKTNGQQNTVPRSSDGENRTPEQHRGKQD